MCRKARPQIVDFSPEEEARIQIASERIRKQVEVSQDLPPLPSYRPESLLAMTRHLEWRCALLLHTVQHHALLLHSSPTHTSLPVCCAFHMVSNTHSAPSTLAARPPGPALPCISKTALGYHMNASKGCALTRPCVLSAVMHDNVADVI